MKEKRKAPAAVAAARRSKEKTPLDIIPRVVARAFLLTLVFHFLSPTIHARAVTPDWEPETVYMQIVSAGELTTEPVPAPASEIQVPVNEKDAEILARLLWSSPLTNEDEKRGLCWLVFNRIDDERLGLFGSTIESVVIRREFTFYDSKAYLSETNLRIAREELRRWNLYLIGAVKERYLDADYLYAAFTGHHVEFKRSK